MATARRTARQPNNGNVDTMLLESRFDALEGVVEEVRADVSALRKDITDVSRTADKAGEGTVKWGQIAGAIISTLIIAGGVNQWLDWYSAKVNAPLIEQSRRTEVQLDEIRRKTEERQAAAINRLEGEISELKHKLYLRKD